MAVGAECHADAELLATLRHGVGEDTVDADRGERERGAGEDREEKGQVPRLRTPCGSAILAPERKTPGTTRVPGVVIEREDPEGTGSIPIRLCRIGRL